MTAAPHTSSRTAPVQASAPAGLARTARIDGAAVVLPLALACAIPHLPNVVTIVVLAAFVARTWAWWRLPAATRAWSLGWELMLLVTCTLVGAVNDWNTVDRHHVYAYTAPVGDPALCSIPTWMLLAWGLVLRALISLSRAVGVRRAPVAHVAVLVALILGTRQTIYRLPLDPVWSWAPFAAALVAALAFLRLGRRSWLLAVAFLVVGPIVEAILIQVAGLHRYSLGWIAGVPLWIALWWPLALLAWAQLAAALPPARPPAREATDATPWPEPAPRSSPSPPAGVPA